MAGISSLNLVVLVGRVAGDVQFDTGKGKDKTTSMARFSLATNEKYGDSPSRAQYHNINVYGKRAEMCNKWLKKGHLLCIKGKLYNRKWKDEEGNVKKFTSVNVDEITFLEKKEKFAEDSKKEEQKES